VISHRWRQLLEERADESVRLVGAVPGVAGLIVGGSVGRGEAWPLSDIDLLPIYGSQVDRDLYGPDVARVQAELVDWWAASGRAQSLDLSWISFTVAELVDVVEAGTAGLATRMSDRRWFHGIDKAFRGRSGRAGEVPVESFLAFLRDARFAPEVVEARVAEWRQQAVAAIRDARVARVEGDLATATRQLRECARALRLVLVEGWGGRLGSMGREWTRFEEIARAHRAADWAAALMRLAGADPAEIITRAHLIPSWLAERAELAMAARQAVGEQVSPERNLRDQVAAFTVHVTRHRPDLCGPWTATPDPRLDAHLAEAEQMVATLAAW
jgi:hypothetical protein